MPFRIPSLSWPKACITAAIAVWCAYVWTRVDPLANGAVPALSRAPSEHWSYLHSNPSLVRDLVAHARKPFWKRLLKLNTMREEIDNADSGGADGHEPESIDDGVVVAPRCDGRTFWAKFFGSLKLDLVMCMQY